MNQFDADRAARHAPAHLTSFEDVRPSLPLTDALRSKFAADMQELMRASYAPRPNKLTPHDSKYHPASQIETPIITENVATNQLIFLLFEQRTNLKGIVCEHYRANGDKFDVGEDFGIDIAPFLNKVSADEIKQLLVSILPTDLDPTDDEQFRRFVVDAVHSIHSQRLLGVHRFLSQTAAEWGNVAEYRNACRSYVRALSKRCRETRTLSGQSMPTAEIQRVLPQLLSAFRINELSTEGISKFGYEEVVATFSDELAETLGITVDPVEGPGDLDFRYAARSFDYVDLGTRYGDCTSRNREKQVHQVPNIFWTIASHLLDVFYQVQELHYRAQPLLKMHLVPCFLRDVLTLNVDAIETTARMRRDNAERDLPLSRAELLELSLQRVLTIAEAMGIEQVTCEPYSNTVWVREQLSRLPSRTYHVSEYRSLYEDAFVTDLAESLLGMRIEVRSEIQALNLRLMDQGLREGYREQKVLRGSIQSGVRAHRGI